MKALGFRNKLVARPVADLALAQSASSQCSLRNRRADLHLTPSAALAAIIFVTVVLLCEPAGAIGWLKALAAGAIVPGGAFAIVRTATGQWGAE
jgi:hypothetical protein